MSLLMGMSGDAQGPFEVHQMFSVGRIDFIDSYATWKIELSS
jgi:hypothetical protein